MADAPHMLTPGRYLRKRREAAGLSLADVAAIIATEPRVAEHARAAWLDLIESDASPATFSTIVALRGCFAFDFEVLEQLTLIALGLPHLMPRLCRICACSERDACCDQRGRCCAWVAADLCSRCGGDAPDLGERVRHGVNDPHQPKELAA